MLRKTLIIAGVILSMIAKTPTASQAQSPLRYHDKVFAKVKITKDITYAENKDYQGKLQKLTMDIYEPEGDTA